MPIMLTNYRFVNALGIENANKRNWQIACAVVFLEELLLYVQEVLTQFSYYSLLYEMIQDVFGIYLSLKL